jgi:hypothetical protein
VIEVLVPSVEDEVVLHDQRGDPRSFVGIGVPRARRAANKRA